MCELGPGLSCSVGVNRVRVLVDYPVPDPTVLLVTVTDELCPAPNTQLLLLPLQRPFPACCLLQIPVVLPTELRVTPLVCCTAARSSRQCLMG